MPTISSNAAIGGLLSSLNTSAGSSMLTAVSGAGSTGSKDVENLTRNQKIDQARNRMYSEAALRMGYMQEGRYEPKADWEKVAAYAMQTGQPVTVSLNGQGKLEAVPQSQADLSRFSAAQQKQLYKAFDELQAMAGKIQANTTNETWVKTLEGAQSVLTAVANGTLVAQSEWERQGAGLTATGKPFKIALDDKGQITIKDQTLEPPSQDLPLGAQQKLFSAVQNIQQTLQNGTLTELWQADAKAMADAGVGFYLDIDPITNQISAKENSGDNIVPKFLRDPPYPDVGADTKWKKTAAELIKSGKPYFLDFDQGGNITVKEASAANVIQYNKPSNRTGLVGNGAVMSLLA